MDNSKFVREQGLEKFMKEQKERYTCQKCGGVISIHDRECSECQQAMDTEETAYRDEGKERH